MFGDFGVDVDGFFVILGSMLMDFLMILGSMSMDFLMIWGRCSWFFCDLAWNLDFKPRKKLFKGWGHVRTMRGAICYRMNGTRASGTACGSSYGHLKF